MNHKQIHDEYLSAVTDFARKHRELDEKHGTYLKCSIVDVPILQVGSIGANTDMTRYSRTISINEIIMVDEAR